jgi:DNA-binding LacI/PurR family transcriptional regulator
MMDVARRAGVSVATVSNVLRGTGVVASDTRERVLVAVADLGYRRNEVARALKRQVSHSIGVVVRDLLDQFDAAVAMAVSRRARQDAWAVLIATTEGDPSFERSQVRALVERRVEGVVFPSVTEGSSIPSELLDRNIPVVSVDVAGHDPRLGTVRVDLDGAMNAVVKHLGGLGHRRIAYFQAGVRYEMIDERPTALAAAANTAGLELVRLDDGPTALCCSDDRVALAVIGRLEAQGLQVPRDLSVVGFDDIPVAGHERFALTTVRQDPTYLGDSAARMLLEAIAEHRHVARTVTHESELIVRSSTAEPPKQALTTLHRLLVNLM